MLKNLASGILVTLMTVLGGCTAVPPAPRDEPSATPSTARQIPEWSPDASAAPTAPASIPFPSQEQTPAGVADHQELERGHASWYGPGFHGRRTANGERYDQHAMTAAHKTLPFGTLVRVRSLVTGKEIDVRVNDRGPFVRGRIIDVSRAAADALGMMGLGVKPVALLVQGNSPQAASSPRPKAVSRGSSWDKSARPFTPMRH